MQEPSREEPIDVRLLEGPALGEAMARLERFVASAGRGSPSWHPRWLLVLAEGLAQTPYCVEAVRADETVGVLPLAYVQSLLFGRFLVSLPYLNLGGVTARDPLTAAALVDRAVRLADQLDVAHLALRHEELLEHAALGQSLRTKVHMRLLLPGKPETLWHTLDPKVRNQIRKGQRQPFEIVWGGLPLLGEFYDVFCRNMRDLGTPVFGQRLFQSILVYFPDEAELCVFRLEGRPVAAALLVHGPGMTEVPSASSLRRFAATNANMLMYWHLLCRAIERGRAVFDFGRSSPESGTFRFKKQWGAQPHPATWQYYVRRGTIDAMRLESGKYDLAVRLWRRLPLWLSRRLGPTIVRGIP